MNLAAFSLRRQKFVYFAAFLIALSGLASYLSMGWLEDPDISVKTAVVIIDYPGATPEEVELEVVEPIEIKLQEMPQLKHLHTWSRDGRAIIRVDIKEQYWTEELPQVWDELRRKFRDVEPQLPPGAGKPVIRDDYGDVYGFVLALSSDGFETHELQQAARELRRELNLMPQVARIELWGEQQRQITVSLSASKLAGFGVSDQSLLQALYQKNRIVDAGTLEAGTRQFALSVSGELKILDDVRQLLVAVNTVNGRQELIRLGDVADIHYSYQQPASQLFRVNGRPAVALAIAPVRGSNIVAIGYRLEQRLKQLQNGLPVGLTIKKIAWQSDYVGAAIKSFMGSLMLSILIVFAVISLTMGLRLGLLIGGVGLGLTVLGSMTLMNVLGVDLHRMSLGALVIAMGMMVDNAIVVTDGFVVRVRQGMARQEAALEAAKRPAMPLLGATLVAVAAFFPVFLGETSAAEYSRTLFIVVGLALMLSWLLSQTLTPLLCLHWVPVKTTTGSTAVAALQGFLRSLLVASLGRPYLSITVLLLCFVMALGIGPFVNRQFFPIAERDQFMVDFRAPEGTHLTQVSKQLRTIETLLGKDPQVRSVSAFIGQGPPRFYLPVDPELPSASYGQLLVTVASSAVTEQVAKRLQSSLAAGVIDTDAFIQVRRFGVGASPKWPVELRVIGPAQASPDTLRKIAGQVKARTSEHPGTGEVVMNWQQRALRLVSVVSQSESSWTGVGREQVARALKLRLDGEAIGVFEAG